MRLNGKKVIEIMGTKNLTAETICQRTGLFEKSLQWILDSGYASDDAMCRIADAIGAEVKEIALLDMIGSVENGIEFVKGSDRATVSFSQGRYISRIRKLAAGFPDKCKILAENEDGSICAHIPVAWVKISPPAARNEQQREQARERMKNYHAQHGTATHEKG